MAKLWTIRPPAPEAERLAQAISVPPLVARVLAARGLTDVPDARDFLKPDLGRLHPPEAMPGLMPAAERLLAAARAGEPIVIYGDYDVDGITASAILWRAMRLAGADVRVYIPNRLEEGYGLNLDAVELLADEGARVLVTVDCGVTSVAEVARARERGLDVIVTDHHEPLPDALPDALAVVNPKLPGSAYPFRDLAGAGVALKLAWAVGQRFAGRDRVTDKFREFLIAATGLAALGTVADVVPLVGENHVLAAFGLNALAGSTHPGIRALIEVSGLAGKRLDAGHVGFMLGPRLNAAGRLGHAMEAVHLLTDAGPDEARDIAAKLDRQNRERQRIERQILDHAEDLLARTADPARDPAIVLAAEGWHTGVIGIVASRLVEKHWRPTILIATAGGKAQGSARSIPGLHLFQALAACAPHLTNFGGHAMAAGLRLDEASVGPFRQAFLAHAARELTADDLTPRLTADAEVALRDLSLEAARLLDRMGPFGAGNPRPVFAARRLRLVSPPRRIGQRGSHLAFHVTEAGCARRAVAWNMGPMADALAAAGTCGTAFTCRVSDFRGEPEIELHVKDLWVGAYESDQPA